MKLSKQQWIEKYGGQALLDREGFEVVPCEKCDDPICHGWRVCRKPKMFYFGPWDEAGHFFHGENGYLHHSAFECCPWQPYAKPGIDCVLQPNCDPTGASFRSPHPQFEGQALVHHKNGWTALSFWDRSVDTRGGCNSTYFAEGTFSFDEMVAMSKKRFAYRWNKMTFEVRLAPK